MKFCCAEEVNASNADKQSVKEQEHLRSLSGAGLLEHEGTKGDEANSREKLS